MSPPVFVHNSDRFVSRRTADSDDAGSSDSFDTDRDLINTSSHTFGGSAVVTLPPEEVLRLTTSQDEHEHEQFDFYQHQTNNNDDDDHNRRASPQTMSHTESMASQSPSVTLPTEQVLSLTMDGGSSHSSGLDFADDYQIEPKIARRKIKIKGKKSSNSSNRDTPSRIKSSHSRVTPPRTKSSSSKDASSRTKSSYSRVTPSRTKSSSSKDASSRTKSSHCRVTPSRTKSSSSRVTPSRTKSSSSRDTPSRTKSSSSKDHKEIRKAVRKEKKSVDAVVAAAIRNYGADEKAESPRKSSKKKSSQKSSPSHSVSRGEDASMVMDTGSTKKKKKKTVRQDPSPDELQPSSGETQAPAAPIDDFGDEHPLSSPLSEQASFSSFSSIDRAGAIAVFPSDSIHATQRRSITDHERISDRDNSRSNLLTNDDEASIERGSVSRAVRRLEDLDSTTVTYEEIPEPPLSQVISATATVTATPTFQSQQTPTMPPPVGFRSRTTSSAMSRGSTNNTSEALSSATMPMSSLDSSADDGFLGGSLVTDVESGTVTAKAISSQDYYAEVRRQLEQEAVIAVDVIPLNEDGRPSESGLNRRNRGRGGPKKNPKAKRSRPSIRKYIWLGVGIGLLAILVVLFLIFKANFGDTSPSFVAPPTPQNNVGISNVNPDITDNNDPDEYDINQNENISNPDVLDDDMAVMLELMEGETASFWRRQFANILPSETLVDLVSDKMYMTPVGKALVFLVENAESLFIIDNMRDYSLSPAEKSKASTIFALVTIYYSLNGPDWFVRNNWLDANVYICEWHGVNCKGDLLAKATIADTAIISEKEGDTNQQLPPGFEVAFQQLPPGFENVFDPTTTFGDDNFDKDIFNNGADDDGNEEGGDDNYYYDFNNEEDDDFFSDKIAIHSLNLKANGLTGTFPRELSLLCNIYDTIDLSVNEIVGSIPTHLGLLSKLQNIMLQQNKLESSLPTELGSMTDLKAFDISGNFEINGTFPEGLDQWRAIERLEIQNTNIKGIVREKFCNMVYERTSPRNEFFFMNEYEWDGTFFFRASCPSPIACPCCTQCCHQDINGKDVCGPILELDYSEDD